MRRSFLGVATALAALAVGAADCSARDAPGGPGSSAQQDGHVTRLPLPDGVDVVDPADVVGEWRVVAIAAGPVPADAVREISISRAGRRGIYIGFSDGLNGHMVPHPRIREDGRLTGRGRVIGTLVGCARGPDDPCTRPSGFGVVEAAWLRLTADGHLVLRDEHGRVLSIYERGD